MDMIEAFSLRSAHLFGDALASQARLRYRVFVRQRSLDHNHFEDMEYDEFDTPGAVYFVWRDAEEIVRGLIRLLPTTLPYMLQRFWPHLVISGDLPRSRSVWEITRLCTDKSFNSPQRPRIMPELMSAVHEYCASNGIEAVIGVTREHLLSHFIRDGIEWLGAPDLVEGELERAFRVPLEHMRPKHHCRKYGLRGPFLSPVSAHRNRAAA